MLRQIIGTLILKFQRFRGDMCNVKVSIFHHFRDTPNLLHVQRLAVPIKLCQDQMIAQ